MPHKAFVENGHTVTTAHIPSTIIHISDELFPVGSKTLLLFLRQSFLNKNKCKCLFANSINENVVDIFVS